MSLILTAVRHYAAHYPDSPALSDGHQTLTYAELAASVDTLSNKLRLFAPNAIGILADNSINWVLADLAGLQLGVPVVPLPGFFAPTQMRHTLLSAGVDLVLTDQPGVLGALPDLPQRVLGVVREGLRAFALELPGRKTALPAGICKITFTSGSTGTPKGVCLSAAAIESVALSLQTTINPSSEDRHLCLLPLATLLENVAGVYVPLLSGATSLVLPLAEVGLSGSSGLDVPRQLAALDAQQASTAIIVPQMLTAQVAAIRAGAPRPRALRYLAVGGGSLSPGLLTNALTLGLPVHEGYGLSECASVVALNRPGERRPGSVGKPLPHVRIEIAKDGEIVVFGAGFAGYLGNTAVDADQPLHTGDLGRLDEDGYLYISGRKKSMFITAFGRNVSPEWIERELLAQPGLMQAAVYGEAQPFNVAVIVPHPAMSSFAISAAVLAANAALPDYARVTQWLVARAPFTPQNNQLTANGRPRRPEISAAYAAEIESIYQGNEAHDVLRRVA
jgi:long-subunit acyl-CoA synthetase (AMP-forming)